MLIRHACCCRHVFGALTRYKIRSFTMPLRAAAAMLLFADYALMLLILPCRAALLPATIFARRCLR